MLKFIDNKIVEDDLPLSGPWSRPRQSPRPVESKPPAPQEDLPVSGPWDGPREIPREDPRPREEAGELFPAGDEREPEIGDQSPDAGRRLEVVKAADPPEETAYLCPERAEPDKQCAGPKRMAGSLFTPRGIYNGFIMAEILGSRGGRSRRRPF
jgi:hypothetical protein